MPSRVAAEHLRRALWSKLEDGSLRGTSLEPVVRTVLRSTNVEWLQRVYRYVGVQELAPVETRQSIFREPRPTDVSGDVLVGHAMPSGAPVFLRLSEFRGHVFIAGQSGAGKSALARLIATQLVASVSVTIYDIEEEYGALAADGDRWLLLPFRSWRRNHFVGPRNIDDADWLNRMIAVVEESFAISPLSASQLRAIASDMQTAGEQLTWPRLLERLRSLSSRGASLRALFIRVLNLLSAYEAQYGVTVGFSPQDVLRRSVIFGLKNVSADQRLTLYADLYSYVTAGQDVVSARALSSVWFFDEFHALFDAAWKDKEPLSLKMLRQISKRGIGVLVCEQSPSTLDARARTNYATRCFFSQRDRTNINYVVDSLDLKEAQRELYKWLPPRQFVMQHPRVPFPFVVRVPDVPTRQLTRRELDERVQRSLAVLGFDQADVRDAASSAPPRASNGSQEALLAYLQGIARYPDMPATERDKLLGLPTARAAALRRQALAGGLAEPVRVNPGGRGKAYLSLRLTAKGRALLGAA